ncbi:MAG: hypothetical protein OEY10_00240 [Nitrosopumilus sp.]|nr:hypothetical protein [Nitrosopumilus sp.]
MENNEEMVGYMIAIEVYGTVSSKSAHHIVCINVNDIKCIKESVHPFHDDYKSIIFTYDGDKYHCTKEVMALMVDINKARQKWNTGK